MTDPYLVSGPEGLVLVTRRGRARNAGPLRLRSRQKQYGGLVASRIYELLDFDSDDVLAWSTGDGWHIEKQVEALGRWSDEIRVLSVLDDEVFAADVPALGPRSRPSPLAERSR